MIDESIQILFVDDEEYVLKALRRIFRGFHDWTYHFADSPRTALDILSSHKIAVLVSDHRMPGMTGAKFLAAVKERRPSTIRMMLTGHADLEAVKKAVNEGEIYRFILKPWDDDELRRAVESAVTFYRVTLENKRLQELTAQQNCELKELNESLEERVVERTEQLSDALHTARAANQSLEQSLQTCAHSFFGILEQARPQVGAHSRRVAAHAKAIGELLSLSTSELVDLEIAAMLHDCGKVGFPAFLLERDPRDYTESEQQLYETHPQLAFDMLKEVNAFQRVATYIRDHHEHFDGSGFPQGANGNTVSVAAYILGAVDFYDRLINRPHSSRDYIYQYTRQQLSDASNKRYPAQVIDALLPYIEEINQTSDVTDAIIVSLNSLTAGMTLAGDIYTMSGTLLASHDTILSRQAINRLRSIAAVDPIAGEIRITRKSDQPSKSVV